MTGHPCPFVRAVVAGELGEARRLSTADGEECEPAVFDQLVEWARTGATGDPARFAVLHRILVELD